VNPNVSRRCDNCLQELKHLEKCIRAYLNAVNSGKQALKEESKPRKAKSFVFVSSVSNYRSRKIPDLSVV